MDDHVSFWNPNYYTFSNNLIENNCLFYAFFMFYTYLGCCSFALKFGNEANNLISTLNLFFL